MPQSLKKGFTLLELLIVIVIIGILAAILITFLNPLEFIRRSGDARTDKIAAELKTAVEAFRVGNANGAPNGFADGNIDANTGWVNELVTAGIAKSSINNQITTANQNNRNLILQGFNTDNPLICFTPQSANYKNSPEYAAAPANLICR